MSDKYIDAEQVISTQDGQVVMAWVCEAGEWIRRELTEKEIKSLEVLEGGAE